MTSWPVLVEDWQIGCCGERFAVGDEVAWTLTLHSNAERSGWPEEMLVELQAKDRRSAFSGTGQAQDILRVAGTEIAVEEGGGDTARGALIEEHHAGVPDELLATRGIVRRIRVVSQQLRTTGNRFWVAGPRDRAIPRGYPRARCVRLRRAGWSDALE